MLPLSPERVVHQLAGIAEPMISPDGASVVYTRSQTNGSPERVQSDLWLCGRDGSRNRRLTWAGGSNTTPRWSPDGGWIAFVSDRSSESAIFVLPIDGGDAREIVRHPSGISEIAWSPEGTSIAFTAAFDPDDPEGDGRTPVVRTTRRRDYKHDARGYLNNRRFQVYVAEVESGSTRMISSDPLDHFSPRWSPDGRTIAAQVHRRNGIHSNLALFDVATGDTTWVGPEDGVVGLWSWTPGGDRLLLAADTEQSWQLDFFMHELDSGTTRRLTDDLRVLPQAGFPTIWAPPAHPICLDDQRALFHGIAAGTSGLWTIDTATGALTEVTRWEALHLGLSADDSQRYVVQSASSLDSTGQIIVFDRETGTSTTIVSPNDSVLDESPLALWERTSVANEEHAIDVWVMKPRDFDPARQYPVILDVHGGPQSFYGSGFRGVPQLLATNGYIVVYANPRGSTSYGRAFAQACIGDWGGGDFRDLMAVVDTVAGWSFVDPERLGIYGYSYGGYMTSWTITQTQRFKAAVCGAPVFDLESFYGTSDVGYYWGPMEWGGSPVENRDWCLAHSPSTFAANATTPTLIIHGEADDRCPIGQGEQMYVLLNENGCEVEFVRYPEGAHAMLDNASPALRVDALQRILGWFDVHLNN